ncbi:hypothetical protein [Dyadobacter bucti]|uniref:hypothetical protein n=1 Tax=Dyadobacter bucti TaxID=2572203 RepID=UPI003F70F0D2
MAIYDKGSVTKIGYGIEHTTLPEQMDVTAWFDDSGQVFIKGNKIYNPDLFKAHQANTVLKPVLGSYISDNYTKFHWSDIMAFALAIQKKSFNKFNGRPVFVVGKRELDATDLNVRARQIVAGGGSIDWNTLMIETNRLDPLVPDDTIQADSPFNPKSPFYSATKRVYAFDAENHYIIYESGEVIWTQTGGNYYEVENGITEAYDKVNQIVSFNSGATLNLKTLELTRDGKVRKVSNTLPWYQNMVRLLLSDTKTQITVVVVLIVLLFIKSKRNYAN